MFFAHLLLPFGCYRRSFGVSRGVQFLHRLFVGMDSAEFFFIRFERGKFPFHPLRNLRAAKFEFLQLLGRENCGEFGAMFFSQRLKFCLRILVNVAVGLGIDRGLFLLKLLLHVADLFSLFFVQLSIHALCMVRITGLL